MDDYEIDDRECPECGHHPTHWRNCDYIGCDGGYVSLYEEDPINFSPDESEKCPECSGTAIQWWCPNCGAELSRFYSGAELVDYDEIPL